MVRRNAQPLYDYIQETFGVDPLVDFKKDNLFTALMQKESFWHEYAAQHNRKLPSDWMEQLRKREKLFIEPMPGMLELIAELKAKGFIIALLTDTTRVRSDFYRSRGFYQPFEPAILSCDYDLRKPDPRLFEILLAKLKLPAGECVFIDNREINVSGAWRIGLPAILFQSFSELIQDLKPYAGSLPILQK